MPKLVRYTGSANTRVIRASDLAVAGIISPDLVFSQETDYYMTVPDVTAIFLLASSGDFIAFDGSTVYDIFVNSAYSEGGPEVLSVQLGSGTPQTGAVVIPSGGSGGTAALRTLGTGPTDAMAGNDSRVTGAMQASAVTGANRVYIRDDEGNIAGIELPEGTVLAGGAGGIVAITYSALEALIETEGAGLNLSDLADVDLTATVSGYYLAYTPTAEKLFTLSPLPFMSEGSGLSAYQIAVNFGFEGDVEEWLASLNGIDGLSAYEVAVDNGFSGTVEEWLEALPGQSAYALAVSLGFVGDEEAWIESLQGEGASALGQTTIDLTGSAPGGSPIPIDLSDGSNEIGPEIGTVIFDLPDNGGTPVVLSITPPSGTGRGQLVVIAKPFGSGGEVQVQGFGATQSNVSDPTSNLIFVAYPDGATMIADWQISAIIAGLSGLFSGVEAAIVDSMSADYGYFDVAGVFIAGRRSFLHAVATEDSEIEISDPPCGNFQVLVEQDSTGGWNVTMAAGPTITWIGGSWTPSTGANSRDLLEFWHIGGTGSGTYLARVVMSNGVFV